MASSAQAARLSASRSASAAGVSAVDPAARRRRRRRERSFADTKLPLTTWFQTIWLVTNQKHGTSALDLQRAIGMSYETAWTVLHKLRRTMVRRAARVCAGVVEVDETYVGGAVPGRRGRGALGKAIVAIAVERLGVGEKSKRVALGRTRLQRIPNVQMPTLTDFVLDTCDLDAIIYTVHWGGYNDLGNVGYTHVTTNVSASGDPAHVAMPCVHHVASLLKRWLLGTHQGRRLDPPTRLAWTSSSSGSTGASLEAAACSSTG